MPKRIYIDTNVVLDYTSDKDNNIMVLMKSVKIGTGLL